MIRGNEIHKELENELHETISVSHMGTLEEVWALKFLNVLFGLSELKSQKVTVAHLSS
jgi:hypothetical protein